MHLWVAPELGSVPVRRGEPDGLIYRKGLAANFELVDSRPLKSGIVVLTYATKANDAA